MFEMQSNQMEQCLQKLHNYAIAGNCLIAELYRLSFITPIDFINFQTSRFSKLLIDFSYFENRVSFDKFTKQTEEGRQLEEQFFAAFTSFLSSFSRFFDQFYILLTDFIDFSFEYINCFDELFTRPKCIDELRILAVQLLYILGLLLILLDFKFPANIRERIFVSLYRLRMDFVPNKLELLVNICRNRKEPFETCLAYAIPRAIFDEMDQLNQYFSSDSQSVWVDKNKIEQFADLPRRRKLAELTYKISRLAMGIAQTCIKELGDDVQINSRVLLSDGLCNELNPSPTIGPSTAVIFSTLPEINVGRIFDFMFSVTKPNMCIYNQAESTWRSISDRSLKFSYTGFASFEDWMLSGLSTLVGLILYNEINTFTRKLSSKKFNETFLSNFQTTSITDISTLQKFIKQQKIPSTLFAIDGNAREVFLSLAKIGQLYILLANLHVFMDAEIQSQLGVVWKAKNNFWSTIGLDNSDSFIIEPSELINFRSNELIDLLPKLIFVKSSKALIYLLTIIRFQYFHLNLSDKMLLFKSSGTGTVELVNSQSKNVNDLAKNLSDALEKRFDYILNFDSTNFCPYFALAALFDPNEAEHVNFLMESIKFLISRCIEMDQDFLLHTDDQLVELDERTKRLQELSAPTSIKNPYALAEKYLINLYSQQLPIDPLEFWKKMAEQDHIKPLLKNGLSYLAIPGTTAPIERVFSLSGLMTKGIMNRTEEQLLNAKLLVHLNS
ncbi:hypothetical protein Mgra_00002384 [Meloidogyne graminicola]|uniref:HAT C-terminal dimerisation domain-containing protein n=1 Tax=Meloidogyne graminicola TaxID=189291 RepID=A0A8S9ZXY3_9BILA|nr:hypothetical protein Mgra_00002384 [Meloidogyne graminicola]